MYKLVHRLPILDSGTIDEEYAREPQPLFQKLPALNPFNAEPPNTFRSCHKIQHSLAHARSRRVPRFQEHPETTTSEEYDKISHGDVQSMTSPSEPANETNHKRDGDKGDANNHDNGEAAGPLTQKHALPRDLVMQDVMSSRAWRRGTTTRTDAPPNHFQIYFMQTAVYAPDIQSCACVLH